MPQNPSLADQYQERNNTLIRTFRDWSIARGDSPDTAEAHEFNLDFYLNHYLLYGSIHTAEEGAAPELVRDFLGNFFVHKAMWTDVEEQKSSIQSLLLFYQWLASLEAVPDYSCKQLEVMIAAEQDQWFAAMEKCSEDSLESWQSTDDEELMETGFFSDFDFADGNEVEDLDAEIDAFEIPENEDETTSPDDAMLLELSVTDEAESDPE